MKNPVTPILLLIVACVIFSCSKNTDFNEGTELQKFRISFSNNQTYLHTYERDASGKIISRRDSTGSLLLIQELEYDANGNVSKAFMRQNGDITHSYEFEYNPDGKLKKRQILPGTLNVADDYNVYSYDAAGHLIIDSQFSRGSGSDYSLVFVSQFVYTGDNITGAEGYKAENGNVELFTRLKYEYDNRLNPFKDLGNHYYFYNETGSSIYTIVNMSRNNVLKQYVETENAMFQLKQTYAYQYNSDNYPVKLESEILDSPVLMSHFEVEYFYKQ